MTLVLGSRCTDASPQIGSFIPLAEDYAPLDVWFTPSVQDAPAPPPAATASVANGSGNKPLAARGGSAPTAKLPGKLYFGLCEEVVRALRAMGGDGDWSDEGSGGVMCKIEWDASLNRPGVPLKVRHPPTLTTRRGRTLVLACEKGVPWSPYR